MNTKTATHTPGPWTVAERNDDSGSIPVRVAVPGGFYIARATNMGFLETEANARLIAEAPGLLAIAQKYHGWDDPVHTRAHPECTECAVIRRAAGGR